EERHRVADASAEVEHPRSGAEGAEPLAVAREVDDLVLGEVLRILARRLDVRGVQRPVLDRELVELGFVHRARSVRLHDSRSAALRALPAAPGWPGSRAPRSRPPTNSPNAGKGPRGRRAPDGTSARPSDRKSTRLNSSHLGISYAVFCLKK